MSDATQTAALIGIGTLLTGLAGGMAFLGALKDETDIQTQLMEKDSKLDAPTAATKARSRRKRRVGLLIACWVAGLAADVGALLVTLLS